MIKDAIESAPRAQPFRPFGPPLTDGALISARYADPIPVGPDGRAAIIHGDEGEMGKIAATSLTTALHLDRPPASGRSGEK